MYALASAHVKAHMKRGRTAESAQVLSEKFRGKTAGPLVVRWRGVFPVVGRAIGVVCFPWWDEPLSVASSAAVAAGLLEGHSRA